jgi:hypothetical protein
MYSVYRNSYCNISATAASDSTKGLHCKRDPHNLWEDEINLNTEGIPRPLTGTVRKRRLGPEALVERCRLQDASFWERKVDDAPVNKRAWVLQERLLAPRVLHFCKDQIAWECRHVDAAESFPHGISNMELKSGIIAKRTRLKALISEDYGPSPLARDLLEESHAAHENWKRVIERYSTTGLAKPEDKLIALAGIAELISHRIGENVVYVAGMWEKNLASQLLWRVNPKYEDEKYKYPQRRPPEWRAPTFSWAAVDAPQGIKCGETLREEQLEISVEYINVKPKDPDRRFGFINHDCYIDLTCSLVKIKIEEKILPDDTTTASETGLSVQYSWRLEQGDKEVTKLKLSNLYMDSPHNDFRTIQERGETYCIPAYKTTINQVNQIICLLVIRKKDHPAAEIDNLGFYERIGIAVVPDFEKKEAKEAIWEATGEKQKIRLV